MAEFVAFMLVLSVVVALFTQHDLFSPAKMFLFSFTLFHLDAWNHIRQFELWMLIMIVLMIGTVMVAFEAMFHDVAYRTPSIRPDYQSSGKSVALWVWLLSMPAILAQIAIVEMFGGLLGYIDIIGNRVIEFRGLGWAKTLISMLLALNLAYMAIGLLENRKPAWWIGYLVHFFVLLVTGLLSGSRSGLLTVFAMQLVLFHYLRRPVSGVMIVLVAALLIGAGGILGTVRNGIKVDDGEVVTGISDDSHIFQAAIFRYGVEPLEILVQSDVHDLALGSTFLSVVTNPVPRALWPDKPDTGGVFFTKLYTGDAWDGASNLTPTFLGEWIINFGWLAGIVMFAVTYVCVLLGVIFWYKKMRTYLKYGLSTKTAFNLIMYVFCMWSAVALMVGEAASVIVNLVLTQILPLMVLSKIVCAGRKA